MDLSTGSWIQPYEEAGSVHDETTSRCSRIIRVAKRSPGNQKISGSIPLRHSLAEVG